MFKYFFPHKPGNKKYQVSVFFLTLMTTFIALAFVVINIGKTAKDKTYTDNAVDAAALAGASTMAFAFNYAAHANNGDEDDNLTDSWDTNIKNEYDEHFRQAQNTIYDEYTSDSQTAQAQVCTYCYGCVDIVGEAATKASEASYNANQFAKEMDSLIKTGFQDTGDNYEERESDGVTPSAAQEHQAQIEQMRTRIHNDSKKDGSDLYQTALYAGYIFAFNNSGISHRLGRIAAKQYEAFLKTITPDKVSNGTAETFTWMDGAFRVHSVTVIISIDDAQDWKLEISQDDRQTVEDNLKDARENAANAREYAGTQSGQWATGGGEDAETVYRSAKKCCGETGSCAGNTSCAPPAECCYTILCPVDPCCPDTDLQGDFILAEQADTYMSSAYSYAEQAKQGIDNDKEEDFDGKDASKDKIINHMIDINHDHKVRAFCFQFHMGGPVKGGRGDIDIPTFYPPVMRQATADFAGSGNIKDGTAAFDSKLE